MFYENQEGSFKILGIFYVERKKREISEYERTHSAISFRIEGNSTFYSNGKEMTAGNGSVSYFPEGCDYHRITKSSEKLIILHLRGIGQIEKDIQIRENAAELEPLFRKMLSVWEENGSTSHNQCMALLYLVFDSLQQMGEDRMQNIPKSIAAGIHRIRQDFRNQQLTITQLARDCHVSESYFRREYRKYAGESPWQTILDLRFRYARALLSSGYYSHKQVSDLSGFSDVKYFRTAFKSRYKMTASEYALKTRLTP